MNICVISQRYPYKDNMEFVFVKKLVDEWAKMGHRCVVITDFSWTTYLRKRIDYRPSHYRDEVAQGIFVDVYNPRIITSKLVFRDVSFDFWMASCAIERQIERLGIQIDIMYCHFFSSALKGFRYAYKHNIPFFVATGESTIPILQKPYHYFNWKKFCAFTRGVIAVSSNNKEEAIEKGYISVNKCEVFPNGTDLSLFKKTNRDECRKVLNFPKEDFIISCVGFICERKGQNRILEAVRKLNDLRIKLLFIGASANINSFPLEGDEILFKGTVENKILPTYLNSSDLFCLPTLAEGCCNAIIEAMACGLPILSSNLPFNRDILDESNSVLVNPNSIDELAEAIKAIRNNDEKRKAMANSSILKSEKLSIEKRATAILDFVKLRHKVIQ